MSTGLDTSSPEIPGEEVAAEVDPFEERINRLMEMLETDPAVRDRMLCELYVTVAEFSEAFRGMQGQMEDLGPRAFMQMIFGRGNHGGE